MNIGESFNVGLQGLKSHKLRSLLTGLGIIFGVAAVIAMLSIGEGAKQEALNQIALMGINNIIVQDFPVKDKETGEGRTNLSMGMKLEDAEAIKAICPLIDEVVPQKELEAEVSLGSEKAKGVVIGVMPEYDVIMNFKVQKGSFINYLHLEKAERVCVLGAEIKRQLFYFKNPVGKNVKIGNQWFTVIGVMEEKALGSGKAGSINLRNLNQDVYIPITTALKRFHHPLFESEIDQITIKVNNPDRIREASNIINGIISKRHNNVKDYQIIVPEELLKQSQKTQRIFNIVMGCIAGISLLVGGIGIMNIMLATVLERTREIGIRRAVGATRKDILGQFIIEAIVLSFTGGIIGIFIGFIMTKIITYYAAWKTIISFGSIFLAFDVSAGIGMIFGIYPAKKAAELDPIESLRYE
ncbi:hypothetical protein DRQ09_04840 [candidate division KSB1 bacterium]|nr:MAG: hypothetical protein DRQ09_04840 [candidate division KSB1 bacterium]